MTVLAEGPADQCAPRECAIDGCGQPASCRGWCIGHYDRWKRGDIDNPNPLGWRPALPALLENVIYLVGMGESPEQIVARLDTTAAAIARAAYRAHAAGKPHPAGGDWSELAKPFGRIQRAERRAGGGAT